MSVGRTGQDPDNTDPEASGARRVLRRVSRSFLSLKKGAPPKTRATLHFDAVAAAMEHLALPDLYRTMSTCRALYDRGIPILLRDVQIVRVRGRYQLRFALYRRHLLRNPARFAWPRRLACPSAALDDRIATLFRALPRHFTALRELALDMNGGDVDEYLAEWVLALAHLRKLEILHVGAHSPAQMALVQRLSPRLELLRITTEIMMAAPVVFHPLRTLEHAAHTLRSLSLECVYPEGGPAILPDDPVFPHVEDLTWMSAQLLSPRELIAAFPGARRVRVENPDLEHRHFAAQGTYPEDALREVRAYNRDVQHCVQRRWARIDYLCGVPVTLWTLGLRCRVATLETELGAARGAVDKPGYTLAVLHDTWPTHLVLDIDPACRAAHLERVLSFPSLRTLDARFRLMREFEGESPAQVLALLRETLPMVFKSRIRRLTVTITTLDDIIHPGYMVVHKMLVKCKPPKHGIPARWRALVPAILEALPLLQELNVHLPRCLPFAWKRDEGALVDDVEEECRDEGPLCACVA